MTNKKESLTMENNKRPTQCSRIKQYIDDFGSITTLEAMTDLGVLRLASRISEMRKNGYDIKDEQVAVKNRYGEKCYIKRYFWNNEKD